MFSRSECIQLWVVGFGFTFLLSVSSIAWAQTQDAINATLIERIAGLTLRLDRIETYISAIIVATLANLIAHVLDIREVRRVNGK